MKRSMARKTSAEARLCEALEVVFTQMLRRFGPPAEARRHFDMARVEILKGIRAIVDARIEQVSKRDRKGQKIQVE